MFPNVPWLDADAAHFTGAAKLQMLVNEAEISVANVAFEAGCRNDWHTHPISQTLIVTEGTGLYQEEGHTARLLQPGDAVYIAKGVKHWHGAVRDASMAHLAITINDPEAGPAVWLEAVTDEAYAAAHEETNYGSK